MVDKNIVSNYYKIYKKRLEKLRLSEDIYGKEWVAPELTVLNRSEIKPVTDEKSLRIKIRVIGKDQVLSRINTWVNNVPVFGVNGIELKEKKDSVVQTDITIALSDGANRIELSASNTEGNESLRESFEVYYNSSIKVKPKLFFVGIGISDNIREGKRISFISEDIKKLSDFFSSTYKNHFSNVTIDTLTRENANKENILNIKNVLSKTNINDAVIVYYIGHSFFDEHHDYYLSTYNSDHFDNKENMISFEELYSILDGIPSRNKYLIVNACNSGEDDKDPNALDYMKQLFYELRRGNGSTVLTSSKSNEFSHGGLSIFDNMSVLGYLFLHGLKEKNNDENNDDHISIVELCNFITNKTQNIKLKDIKMLIDKPQNPTLRYINEKSDFIIY